MYDVGFDFNKPEIAQYKGLDLTNAEQSSFNKYMHSEGKLEGRLKFLFTQNKKYKKLTAQYNKVKKGNSYKYAKYSTCNYRETNTCND